MHNSTTALACALILVSVSVPVGRAAAHCDQLDGPVVVEARKALEAGDVTPLLKWIAPADEAELTQAFEDAVEVRKEGGVARELADRYFFETLVGIHRASEGEPFTGLKPAGTPVSEPIELADKAVATGSVEALVKTLTAEVEHGLRERFDALQKAAEHKDESVEAGRAYVAAYVKFIHYAEGLGDAAEGAQAHGSPSEADDAHAAHAGHEG